MKVTKLFGILTCYLVIFCQQIVAQFGAMGYYPYPYGGGNYMFGRPGRYPNYGYNLQYPIYGSYPCYLSVYCGGGYGFGGYPYYYNNFNSAFTSSSSSAYYGSNGGYFG